jgi:hypothetical protein
MATIPTAAPLLLEVPLAFPGSCACPRYLVHDDERASVTPTRTWRTDADFDAARGSSSALGRDLSHARFSDAFVLRGAASVSALKGLSTTLSSFTNATLATTLLAEQPWILSLTLLNTAPAPSASAVIAQLELDLSETQTLRDIVRVRAFALDRLTVRLIVVDTNATALVLNMVLHEPRAAYGTATGTSIDTPSPTLIPNPQLTVVSVTNLLGDDLTSRMAPPALRPSMLEFLSATHLLLSLNPFLLCVNLESNEISLWSQSWTQRAMQSRQSTWTRWIGTAAANAGTAAATGALHGTRGIVLDDMPPVAALTVAEHLVFTLHSDASVRRWILPTRTGNPSSADSALWEPREVWTLRVPALPSSDLWSESPESTQLQACLYNDARVYALVVHIQTTDAADEICHLVVVDGDVAAESEITTSRVQTVPPQASALVDMQLHPGRCALSCWYRSKQYADAGSGDGTSVGRSNGIGDSHDDTSLWVHYQPSHSTMVSSQPTVTAASKAGHDALLDALALQERTRILNLHYSPYGTNLTDTDLEEALHQIDKLFLSHLFRPEFVRGTGTTTPPLEAILRRVLHQLVPHYRDPVGECGTERRVLLALHEWRSQQQNRNLWLAMTPGRHRHEHDHLMTPGTTTANAPPHTNMSLYDSLLQLEDDEDLELGSAMDRGMMEEDEDEWERAEIDKESQMEAHEERWRQFLLTVWEEERMMRLPVAMGLVSCSTDLGILVRPSTISVLAQHGDGPPLGTTTTPLLLDQIASKLVTALEMDEVSAARLYAAEQAVHSVIARGDLAWHATEVDRLPALLLVSLQDCLWDVVMPHESNLLIEGLKNATETDLIQFLLRPPVESTLPGLGLLVSSKDSTGTAFASSIDEQQRLATSSLATRCMNSIRRLTLGRCLVLSQIMTTRPNSMSAAWLIYFQAVATMFVSAQHIALSNYSLPSPSADSPSSSSPLTKRPSFGSGGSGVSNSKTTVLDASLQATFELDENNTTSMTKSIAQRVKSFLKKAFNLALVPLNDTPSYSALPELGILPGSSGNVIDQPKLALRLLAPVVALPPPCPGGKSIVVREEAIAECLLIASHSESDDKRSQSMVEKAFKLLKFDEQDLVKGMRRLETLQRHTASSTNLAGLFILFIEEAIQKMQALHDEDALNSMHDYSTLWSNLFNTAITSCKWDTAYHSCLNNPDPARRAGNIQRMVRAMVDAGDLSALLSKCVAHGSKITEDSHLELFRMGGDLYGIAVETLAEASSRDLYLFQVVKPEPLADYQAALYVLHCSQGQWRRAAQSLDLRYVNARTALLNGPSGTDLDNDKKMQRESLIIHDMALAALGCSNAIRLVDDKDVHFIVSGEQNGAYPSLPISLNTQTSPRSKRDRGLQILADGDDEVNAHKGATRLSRYMDVTDIETRGVRASVLCSLFEDDGDGYHAAKTAFLQEVPTNDTDNTVLDKLFARGYYGHGIALASMIAKVQQGKPDGVNVFYDSLSHLVCTYLVPIATDRTAKPTRPTFSQIQTAFDSVGDLTNPSVLVVSRTKKISLLQGQAIREGAMAVLQRLVLKYTSTECPVAVDVAAALLGNDQSGTSLPTWLEHLLVYGADPSVHAPGLFAKRRVVHAENGAPNESLYLGDPSILLTLYTERGLYMDACRVVELVLTDPSRKTMAASFIPEKGMIDFVPYPKIDLLHSLMDVVLRKNGVDEDTREELRACQDSLRDSLEQHFRLLKIGESGLRSARALA